MQNDKNAKKGPNPELVAIMLAHALEFAQKRAVGQEVASIEGFDSNSKPPLCRQGATSPQVRRSEDTGREAAA